MKEQLRSETAASRRLIVALDVPRVDEALSIVDELANVVSFYKVGTELFMSGGMERLLRELIPQRQVFVDLKLAGDIPETVRRTLALAAQLGVRFITLSTFATRQTIRSACLGRADHDNPKILFVSFLSSLDKSDFAEIYGEPEGEFTAFLEQRTKLARAAGADGFIVSGREIALLRAKYPDAILVSPGIRPHGSATDDHKRFCTPAEAIRLGTDYLVVGRPIRDASNRVAAAQSIIDEVARELENNSPVSPQ